MSCFGCALRAFFFGLARPAEHVLFFFGLGTRDMVDIGAVIFFFGVAARVLILIFLWDQ
jgi:hypothetical protein